MKKTILLSPYKRKIPPLLAQWRNFLWVRCNRESERIDLFFHNNKDKERRENYFNIQRTVLPTLMYPAAPTAFIRI